MRKKTNEEFISDAKKVHGNKYDYSKTIYKGNKIKVIIICKKHGAFEQRTDDHLIGKGCSKCRIDTLSSTLLEFKTKAKKVHGDKYEYSKTIYKGNKSKVIIICKKHGVFEQRPDDHLAGKGCPNCKEYKGEKKIKEFLIRNNIEFETQKKFPECKNKSLLSYDFFLPKQNLLIEFNGIQHYRAVSLFGGEAALKKQKENDKIKEVFAKRNKIKLLTITYRKENSIEKILKRELLL